MLSIWETKEVSHIFVAKIFLELLAIIFDTFIIDHTVVVKLLSQLKIEKVNKKLKNA